MSSGKRRKVERDISTTTHNKVLSDTESSASSSSDPETKNALKEGRAAEAEELPKTFKDLVCYLFFIF
jgi:hypothetical protein